MEETRKGNGRGAGNDGTGGSGNEGGSEKE